ncbi:glycosyltransferase family 2 protein [Bradyrhizobium sp. CB82]|uniref:glycosyltransferase family 2 protein n=1 Tax=Bradyrhizobium sp. CB82 TaxID=3039159 RepID=UPI0024B09B2D|nr:glycosyltransferase family 2 protein [Bradyrhizobium sp. CB82]WFU39397.1 glycosyltransferase family 2 protein [Bradyrhizobium sp. CB82]
MLKEIPRQAMLRGAEPATIPSLSVIIPNHNYAAYVGSAIRSALDIRWPKVEVIVVDDGSTDNSLEVINEFADEVTVISQPNAGQMPSCVNGFRKSSGDVIIFLDSDDVLHPDVMTEIASVSSKAASKYQFQMRVIDAKGQPTGNVLPQYFSCPASDDIRRWMTTTGAYPTPPGSGNAYPRWFVERVFSFESDFVDRAPDSYLLAAAPACGHVVTITKPLADYRVHGLNHGAFLQLDDTRFAREIDLTRRRYEFFLEVAQTMNLPVTQHALNRNLTYLCLRTASYRLRPDIHPIAREASIFILVDALRAFFYPQGFSTSQSASLLLWILCVLVSPSRLERKLVGWRYVPAERPKWIKSMLSQLRVLR